MAGVNAGTVYVDVKLSGIEKLKRDIAQTFQKVGVDASESVSKNFNKTVSDKIVDQPTKRNIISKFFGAGNESGLQAGEGFITNFSKRLSNIGDIAGPYVTVALVGIAIAAAPVVAAAFISALGAAVGVGFLGIGALALKGNKKLADQFSKTFDSVGKTLEKAAQPLVKPFLNALKQISTITKSLGPDLKAVFSALAPIVPVLTKGIGSFLTEVLHGIKDALPGITAAFKAFSLALGPLGTAVGNLFRTLFANPEVIAHTTELIMSLINSAIKPLGPLLSGLNVIFGAMANILHMASQGWKALLDTVLAWVFGGTDALSNLSSSWSGLWSSIKNVWDQIKAFAAARTDQDMATRFMGILQAIKDAWGPLKNFLGSVWDAAWAGIKNIWNSKVVPWWEGTVKPWLETQAKEYVKGIFRDMIDGAIGYLKSLPGKAGPIISAGISAISAWFSALPGKIGSALSSLPAKVINIFSKMLNSVLYAVSYGITSLIKLFIQLPGKTISAVASLPGKIKDFFSNADDWLVSAGKAIISGLISGIKSAIGAAVKAASSAMGSVVKGAKDALGIHSPSTVFRGFGQNVVKGFVLGLDDMRSNLSSSMTMFSDAPRFQQINGDPSDPIGGTPGAPLNITQNNYDVEYDARKVNEDLVFLMQARGYGF